VACTGDADWIRIGLMWIRGLRTETMNMIVAERKKAGPYRSLLDFWSRVDLHNDEMRMLILSGIFDSIEPDLTHPAMHYLYEYWAGAGKLDGNEWYAEQRDRARRFCQLYTFEETREHEIEVFGTLISEHPLAKYAPAIARVQRIMAKDLRQHVGKNVRLVGIPLASKDVITKNDEAMQFWAFEDESGVFHGVLFPRAYEKFCRFLVDGKPLLIFGVVQEEYSSVALNVYRIERISHV